MAVMPDVLADMDYPIDVVELIREKVERGELGAKTGKGFYDWTLYRDREMVAAWTLDP